MKSRPVSLRLSEEVRSAIDETARRTRRPFSSVANEMLEEAVRMRRIPGIYFADTPTGREAHVEGTGLGVWEVIAGYRRVDEDGERLRKEFDWLSEHQLRAALAYFEAYPKEINERIAEDEYWTPDRIWEEHPFTRPPWR